VKNRWKRRKGTQIGGWDKDRESGVRGRMGWLSKLDVIDRVIVRLMLVCVCLGLPPPSRILVQATA
jgi:hypothetical protein